MDHPLLEVLKQEIANSQSRPVSKPGECPLCGAKPPFKFKDELSVKEFGITGVCQPCQDKLYDVEAE